MNIYCSEFGKPKNISERQEKEQKTYSLLEKLKIEFFRVDHDSADTMEDCDLIDETLGVKMCKNLFLCNQQKTKFYLLMLPGEKKFSSKDFSKAMEISRVSFAPGEFMEKYLDILPGSVSVMGVANDSENNVTVVIDREIAENEYIGCHPCVNTSSLRIKTEDILEKFLKETEHQPIILDI